LRLLKKLGVNRFTIGGQSFDEEVLKKAGRTHKVKDIYKSYFDARRAGIPVINLDIVIGLVGETWYSYNLMFQGIADLKPDCVSALCLDCGHLLDSRYDKEARKTQFLTNRKFRTNILSNLYCILEKLGYERSRGSSESIFVLRGTKNAANRNLINRLKLGYTFGIGISAESSLGPFKYRTVLNKREYFNNIENGKLPRFIGTKLNRDEHIRRYFIYNFLHWGKINKKDFQKHFNLKKDVNQIIRQKFRALINEERIFDTGEEIIFLPVSLKGNETDNSNFQHHLSLPVSLKKKYYVKLTHNLLFCIKYFYSSNVIERYKKYFGISDNQRKLLKP
jgi:oxygen-independent coproporphyrinogen-3 oxidase